jgi:4-diphosphocytidyl-2-C-methyl-D-erythritol kinase
MAPETRPQNSADPGLLAPAKINLFLEVTGRRADGYHELSSLVAFADFGDRVQVEPAADFSLNITGPFAAALEQGEGHAKDNLLFKTAFWLQEKLNRGDRLAISLEKNLPVAAGLGGGSADAAALLRALTELWGFDPKDLDPVELARDLGADLPVCLLEKPCLVSGIGEELNSLPPLPPLWLLLANPGLPLSTAAVFQALTPPFSTAAPWPAEELASPAFIDALKARCNDLEAPAKKLMPEIGQVLEALEALPSCLLARMSGSGPTCFGLFASAEEARTAHERLSEARPGWWLQAGRLQSA